MDPGQGGIEPFLHLGPKRAAHFGRSAHLLALLIGERIDDFDIRILREHPGTIGMKESRGNEHCLAPGHLQRS